MAWADGVKFRVIVADPPWETPITGFVGKAWSAGKDNSRAGLMKDGWYKDGKTISVAVLSSVSLPKMDGSCLFLWCTSGNMPFALQVMSAWGFAYKANFVWAKISNGASGLCGEWTGYWSRTKHEILLFGVSGKFRRDTKAAPFDSVFLIPRVKGGYGAKPDGVYDLIQSVYAGPYLELFARRRRPNWFAYGNELEGGSDISIPEWDSVAIKGDGNGS